MKTFNLPRIKSVMDTVLGICDLNCSQSEGEIYDNFEWDIVVTYRKEGMCTFCERLEGREEELVDAVKSPNFDGMIVTLFAHVVGGGVAAIHDFQSIHECKSVCETLTHIFLFGSESK